LGLIERDGYYSRLTQSGKECIELANRATTPPQEPAPVSAAGEVDDSGYSELIDELNGRIKSLERDNAHLKDRLGEAVEAFTELLGVVAISKDVSQYDFNVARKALQQLIKDAAS
jgi:hypothetical protein